MGKGAGVCESMDMCEVARVCGHMREAKRRRDQQGMLRQILIQVNSYRLSCLSLKKKKIQALRMCIVTGLSVYPFPWPPFFLPGFFLGGRGYPLWLPQLYASRLVTPTSHGTLLA